jgi:hypothetical protein
MEAPKTHADVIALWPTRAEFARAIGVSASFARTMARDGIPPRRFNAVVDAVARAGFAPITYADLAQMPRTPGRRDHGQSSSGHPGS